MPSDRIGDDVCVVVPAYNEAAVISQVVSDLRARFDHVVCVDDGSTDETARAAESAGATVLRHGVNLGQGAALETGMAYARDVRHISHIITFDGDGQHRVIDAEAALRLCRERELDIVLGSRNLGSTDGQTWSRRLLLAAALRFSRALTGLALTDTHNGLRVLARPAFEGIRLHHAGMAYASELEAQIGRLGLRWAEVAVDIRYTEYSRGKGQRSINAVNILCDLATTRLGLS